MNTIVGKKEYMSAVFDGVTRTPVTVVKAGPCTVTQIKTIKTDGYNAIQVGFGERKLKGVSKALVGHTRGSSKENSAPRFLCEVRTDEDTFKVGDEITLTSVLAVGDTVSVQGVSKGKGFQGGVKRWGFSGGPKTHGQSDRHRAPGSIGAGTTPGRVLKGKHMAGRMGRDTVTVANLKVVEIDADKAIVKISGAIPGPRGSIVLINKL